MTHLPNCDKPEKTQALEYILHLIQSGYAGVDKDGKIKDRRFNSDLTPCYKNDLMNTPEPKTVGIMSAEDILKYGTLDRKFNPR